MTDLSTIRVLEADDCATWRLFVMAQLLTSSVQLVATAVDGVEAVQKARVLRPDVIIMDLYMPKLNGLAATREIRAFAPESKILIVSNERDPDVVQAALAAGARGYVLKALAAVELLPAVEAIARGDVFIGRGLTLGANDFPGDAY